ncbi:MAG TPA: gamma-glutamylcyclotransferase family protein [Pyrinomonadaceae bacterium]|nr:gamma-glutamylcyclotransferase family protein [Pyrinomonadaceae bacterium]
MIHDSENLFSYGTLQMEPVQLAAFGRKLTGQPDALIGYQLESIATNDHEFEIKSGATQHRNLRYTGVASDLVEGTVFQLTKAELKQADTYEPWDYQRVQVELKSGATAWVYLNKNA